MKVFGIGLNKTGTSSLHRALELLGYRSLHGGGLDTHERMLRAIDERKPMLRVPRARPDAISDVARGHLLLLPRRPPVPGLEVHPHAARHGRVARQPPPARRAQPADEGSRRIRRRRSSPSTSTRGRRSTGATRRSCAPTSRTGPGPARLPAGGRRLGAAVRVPRPARPGRAVPMGEPRSAARSRS